MSISSRLNATATPWLWSVYVYTGDSAAWNVMARYAQSTKGKTKTSATPRSKNRGRLFYKVGGCDGRIGTRRRLVDKLNLSSSNCPEFNKCVSVELSKVKPLITAGAGAVWCLVRPL